MSEESKPSIGPGDLRFLEELRTRGVRRAKFRGWLIEEVEFFGADAPPTDTPAVAGETDFERELNERTEGYEVALQQVAQRRFQKGGES